MTADAPRLWRRQRRPELGTGAWQKVRRAVLARDAGICQYCGAEATLVDHVAASGMPYDPANLVAACRSCNNSKRGLPIEEWYRRAGKPLPSWYGAYLAGDGRLGAAERPGTRLRGRPSSSSLPISGDYSRRRR